MGLAYTCATYPQINLDHHEVIIITSDNLIAYYSGIVKPMCWLGTSVTLGNNLGEHIRSESDNQETRGDDQS